MSSYNLLAKIFVESWKIRKKVILGTHHFSLYVGKYLKSFLIINF